MGTVTERTLTQASVQTLSAPLIGVTSTVKVKGEELSLCYISHFTDSFTDSVEFIIASEELTHVFTLVLEAVMSSINQACFLHKTLNLNLNYHTMEL